METKSSKTRILSKGELIASLVFAVIAWVLAILVAVSAVGHLTDDLFRVKAGISVWILAGASLAATLLAPIQISQYVGMLRAARGAG